MKKRLAFIIVLVVLFTATFIIYNGYQYKEKSIADVAKLKNKDITKIVLTDGRDISKTTIEGKQKINEFMKLIDSDIIRKEKTLQDSNGWSDYIDFYSDDRKLMTIGFTIDLEIEGEHYEIIKGDLTQKKIIELINSTISQN